MKLIFKLLLKAVGIVAIACGTALSVRAESRNFSMPGYLANPGGFLQVPLMLDNAAGLAAIQIQVNFDPEVVELQSVTIGPLGQAFEMSQGDGDGFVQLTFFRGEALAVGSGRLAVLRFRANPGAVTDLFSELTIANLVLSDSTGVIDLRQKDTLTMTNGQVAVSMQPNIDNTGSGLPDWWEDQYGLDPFVNNRLLDPESDGLNNLLEYAFGTNPTAGSDGDLAYIPGGAVTNPGRSIRFNVALGEGVDFRAIFTRRKDYQAAGLTYTVQFSADLTTWTTSTATPTMLTGPGDSNPAAVEAVSVPYPLFIPVSDGGYIKPNFFRISVSLP